jgi:hypothetical protein
MEANLVMVAPELLAQNLSTHVTCDAIECSRAVGMTHLGIEYRDRMIRLKHGHVFAHAKNSVLGRKRLEKVTNFLKGYRHPKVPGASRFDDKSYLGWAHALSRARNQQVVVEGGTDGQNAGTRQHLLFQGG